MRKCTTGLTALRAGVPAGWITADKTGAGANGTRNDVALLRRPGRAPIVIAAYLTGATAIDADRRNAALAAVARAVCADMVPDANLASIAKLGQQSYSAGRTTVTVPKEAGDLEISYPHIRRLTSH